MARKSFCSTCHSRGGANAVSLRQGIPGVAQEDFAQDATDKARSAEFEEAVIEVRLSFWLRPIASGSVGRADGGRLDRAFADNLHDDFLVARAIPMNPIRRMQDI